MISATLVLAGALAAAQPPNLVLFLSDDHGWRDSQPYGSPDAQTPNLAGFASQGLRFTQASCASPSCAPSRASLYSGLFPARHGVEPNHSTLRDGVRLLPDYLRPLGYRTALIGKSHLRPLDRFNADFLCTGWIEDVDIVREAGAWLDRYGNEKPFCLVVAVNDPHVPWKRDERYGYDPARLTLPPSLVDTPKTRAYRADYLSDVTRMDERFGDLLGHLDRTGLAATTVVCYTSDNGAQWPGGKWNLYDDGIRMPFLVRWPSVIAPGGVSEALISHVDLLPTWVELAGGTPDATLDGRSFAAVLHGAPAHREAVFATHTGDGGGNVVGMRSIRTARWQLIVNLNPAEKFLTCEDQWRDRNYFGEWIAAAQGGDAHALAMVNRHHWRVAEELYDLEADPHQLVNRAGNPELAPIQADLRRRLDEWRIQQQDGGRLMTVLVEWSARDHAGLCERTAGDPTRP